MKEIACVSDLVDILKIDYANYGRDVWYRGQGDYTWTLSPGLLRLTGLPSENSFLTRFKQSAAMLIDRHPKDSFDWMFLMQHYGVPTRLLDWSESPLTALFFAVSDKSRLDTDGALWSLKPIELNKIAGVDVDEENFILCFDDEELKSYSLETLSQNPRNKLTPLATIATRNNPRIQAQLGVFTIHHLDHKPIEDFCLKEEVIKYRIPKNSKEEIRKELKLLGISKFTLFPELSSIGEILTGTFI
ncbi:FRG domain-containing protein [Mucilaginibacter hurinus]|uniref:FRG domain-containing protein n=1 Tax=Mucilaginibacter hurinus TaxID=2201324 RepID=A0A367GLR1_9SPHI|nr:FRG domain-containing protein [Mucilaginibacter hurinus]RCH54422.1 FRG domain-containing protein [Mucilaginibacter hurinus]